MSKVYMPLHSNQATGRENGVTLRDEGQVAVPIPGIDEQMTKKSVLCPKIKFGDGQMQATL